MMDRSSEVVLDALALARAGSFPAIRDLFAPQLRPLVAGHPGAAVVLLAGSGSLDRDETIGRAQRSQPSAVHRKRSRPETAESKPKPSRSASLRRMSTSMVRRGSTVRVR